MRSPAIAVLALFLIACGGGAPATTGTLENIGQPSGPIQFYPPVIDQGATHPNGATGQVSGQTLTLDATPYVWDQAGEWFVNTLDPRRTIRLDSQVSMAKEYVDGGGIAKYPYTSGAPDA